MKDFIIIIALSLAIAYGVDAFWLHGKYLSAFMHSTGF